jgi:hypothetical protein
MNVYSGSAIPAFRRHVTIYTRTRWRWVSSSTRRRRGPTVILNVVSKRKSLPITSHFTGSLPGHWFIYIHRKGSYELRNAVPKPHTIDMYRDMKLQRYTSLTTVLNRGGQIQNPWGGERHPWDRRLGRTPSRFGSRGEDSMETNVVTVGLLH